MRILTIILLMVPILLTACGVSDAPAAPSSPVPAATTGAETTVPAASATPTPASADAPAASATPTPASADATAPAASATPTPASADPTGTPTPATADNPQNSTPSATPATMTPSDRVIPGEVPTMPQGETLIPPYAPAVDAVVQGARADLAQRRSIAVDTIEVEEVRLVVWPDGGLGCPNPDRAYIQVPVDGMFIQLRVGDQTFNYHSGKGNVAFLCER